MNANETDGEGRADGIFMVEIVDPGCFALWVKQPRHERILLSNHPWKQSEKKGLSLSGV